MIDHNYTVNNQIRVQSKEKLNFLLSILAYFQGYKYKICIQEKRID